MKLMFASDIHGSLSCCRRMSELYFRSGASRLLLLGDLLYHGPRNDLPVGYNPKGVISLLNSMKSELLCVRGNCEAEVDQMVLEFPVMADYMTIFEHGRMFLLTHGHLSAPELMPGDVAIQGHTHLKIAEKRGETFFLNPGSVSLPKDGDEGSCMFYEDGVFTICALDGTSIKTLSI